MQNSAKPRTSILDKQIFKVKSDVINSTFLMISKENFNVCFLFKINLSTFALLISEMVQYTNKRSSNSTDFQTK